jgi:hypothetical protein
MSKTQICAYCGRQSLRKEGESCQFCGGTTPGVVPIGHVVQAGDTSIPTNSLISYLVSPNAFGTAVSYGTAALFGTLGDGTD